MGDKNQLAFELVFLGTSSGTPTLSRNVTAITLHLPQSKELWLFDCGEGTQQQFLKLSHLKPTNIRKIFITHMHGDHVLGLPGLLATLHMLRIETPIDIYGPPELSVYLEQIQKSCSAHFPELLNIHTVKTGLLFKDQQYSVYAEPLDHRITSHGYRVVQADTPGTLDAKRLQAAGVAPGPIYERLKRGEKVTLANGNIINGQDFLSAPHKGRIMTYCSDTIYCNSAISLAKTSDVLIHEATFSENEIELAKHYKHATAKMAATVAKEAQAKKLILTHFSPRYDERDLTVMLEEAQAVFPNTLMAYDLQSFLV